MAAKVQSSPQEMGKLMTNKKVYLITGATGFIGSCLLRELINKNEKVHIILRKKANLWRIKDILGQTNIHFNNLSNLDKLSKLIKKIRPNIIYHLATYGAYSSQNDANLCIKTNVQGTWNLLRATADIDYELFVNTGSSSEYGFKTSPMKETDLLEPASYYAVTKSSQTLLCSYFAKVNNKPVVTLRPFSVYGAYEDGSRFIPTLLKSLYFHKKMNLVSPYITRDWIYVDDVVNAYLSVNKLSKYGGEIFNIGTGTQKTIKEVVELAVKVTAEKTTFKWKGMKNRIWDTDCWVADISKSARLLKWKPKVNLEQGLLLTWKWFKNNLRLYT
jgi:nucleoside-diphosphate-sugar epimerase